MLGFTKTIGQLATASSVCWYGHVLRRELDIGVEGQWREECPMRIWKKLVEEESGMVGLRREDALCRSKWFVGVYRFAAGLK